MCSREQLWLAVYRIGCLLTLPFNVVMVFYRRNRVIPKSVFHISYPVHTAAQLVAIQNQYGLYSRYLAIGENPHWKDADYSLLRMRNPIFSLIRDWYFFWFTLSRFAVIHSHFGIGFSPTGWEYLLLQLLKRRVVVHFRGCEARNRETVIRQNPNCNICENCDYSPRVCARPDTVRRRRITEKFADQVLVTTPDLQDFWPDAIHIPFLFPTDLLEHTPEHPVQPRDHVMIVHATNHPGIEGTSEIVKVVEDLRAGGIPVKIKVLKNCARAEVLENLADADLSIGKMKMGYYANFQIESMALNVPAIAFIRPEFITNDLRQADGLVFTALSELKATLTRLCTNEEERRREASGARGSAMRLHDNGKILAMLSRIYGFS